MGLAAKQIAMDRFGFDAYCQKLKQFYLDLYREENHA